MRGDLEPEDARGTLRAHDAVRPAGAGAAAQRAALRPVGGLRRRWRPQRSPWGASPWRSSRGCPRSWRRRCAACRLASLACSARQPHGGGRRDELSIPDEPRAPAGRASGSASRATFALRGSRGTRSGAVSTDALRRTMGPARESGPRPVGVPRSRLGPVLLAVASIAVLSYGFLQERKGPVPGGTGGGGSLRAHPAAGGHRALRLEPLGQPRAPRCGGRAGSHGRRASWRGARGASRVPQAALRRAHTLATAENESPRRPRRAPGGPESGRQESGRN